MKISDAETEEIVLAASPVGSFEVYRAVHEDSDFPVVLCPKVPVADGVHLGHEVNADPVKRRSNRAAAMITELDELGWEADYTDVTLRIDLRRNVHTITWGEGEDDKVSFEAEFQRANHLAGEGRNYAHCFLTALIYPFRGSPPDQNQRNALERLHDEFSGSDEHSEDMTCEKFLAKFERLMCEISALFAELHALHKSTRGRNRKQLQQALKYPDKGKDWELQYMLWDVAHGVGGPSCCRKLNNIMLERVAAMREAKTGAAGKPKRLIPAKFIEKGAGGTASKARSAAAVVYLLTGGAIKNAGLGVESEGDIFEDRAAPIDDGELDALNVDPLAIADSEDEDDA